MQSKGDRRESLLSKFAQNLFQKDNVMFGTSIWALMILYHFYLILSFFLNGICYLIKKPDLVVKSYGQQKNIRNSHKVEKKSVEDWNRFKINFETCRVMLGKILLSLLPDKVIMS